MLLCNTKNIFKQIKFLSREQLGIKFQMRAILICAVFNRRETTLKFLRSLDFPEWLQLDVYMIDGGSTDGTPESVEKEFPQVVFHSVPGTWWCSGMRILMEKAVKENPDWIILANDDTVFYPGAIRRSCEFARDNVDGVCVGVCDDSDGIPVNGGRSPVSQLRPLTMKLKTEGIAMTWNANFVFVPRLIYERVGVLSWRFLHNLGDYEYGLRVSRSGFANFVIPESLGTSADSVSYRWWLTDSDWQARWRASQHPKALPWREWWYYCWTYGGVLGVLVFIKCYLDVFRPRCAENYKKLAR